MKINIQNLAKLSNITLPTKLEEKIEEQLEKTLDHVENLKKIDTSDVTGTNQVTNLSNVFRDDIVGVSLSQKEVLSNGKDTYNGFFVVDQVLSQE